MAMPRIIGGNREIELSLTVSEPSAYFFITHLMPFFQMLSVANRKFCVAVRLPNNA